jgi:hypothetical protein
MVTAHKVSHYMLHSKAALRKFLGQDPIEWFLDRGFNYYCDQIGFNIQHNKTFKSERFDYSFNSEAIKMVMDQLANPNNPPQP